MKKQYLQHGVLMLAVVSWFFIPHFLTGWPGVGVMAAVSIFCMVFYSKTRSWWPKKTLPDKLANKRATICLAISIAVLFFYCPILLIGVSVGKDPSVILSLVSICLSVMNWHTYTRVGTTKPSITKAEGALGASFALNTLSCLFIFLRLYGTYDPFLWLVAVVGCLSVCLLAYITYQVPLRNSIVEIGWPNFVTIAVILTLLINLHFGTSTGKIMNYVALDDGKYGMSCELDNGDTFIYARCPTPVGCTGRIKLHEGWFHIQYVEPIW